MHVLVAEDDRDIGELITHYVQKNGWTAYLTPSGTEALAYARQHAVDLAILDLMLPGMTGLEICRALRAEARTAAIPIIMVTAKADLSNLQEAFAAGAMDFISKPVNSIELLARVASALLLKQEMDRRKNRELDLHRSNEELQKALKEVKSLRGLIPICASCKKIRNDGGFWQQLEEYLAEHLDAEFSHGLCQPCIKKLYPGVYQD